MTDRGAAEFSVDGLCVFADGEPLLRDASFSLNPGELVVLLGPNGAGKTTLLRAALGLIPAAAGTSAISGAPVSELAPAARAQAIAYLPQARPLAWPILVRDIVSLGRFSHGAALGRLSDTDAKAVAAALAASGLEGLANRRANTLSGGELARVHCARAFAAQTPFLIADEPVAALDPRHQHRIMTLIRDYVTGEMHKGSKSGALCVLHDIALAAQYADRLIWMKNGRIVADGPPAETLTVDRLAEVYGVQARIQRGAQGQLDVYIDGPS